MKLSLFCDYSLRILIYAALKESPFVLDEVAAAYGISRNHLAKVLQNLVKLGYLDTQRGRGGGIQLALEPEAIRLGKLVRETDSESAFVECFDPAANKCPINGCCRLKGILAESLNGFYASLDRHTLRDLVTGPQRSLMSKALGSPI